jgi:cation:H+ antiporter
MAIALLLLLLIVDGEVSRADGALLVLTFAAWMSVTLAEALTSRPGGDDHAVETVAERRHARAIGAALIGLVLLVLAGRLLVEGAKAIGEDLGISTFVVGVVLVSLGTSLPELATGVVARVRGHAEIGFGTALGSNIFNTGFIVGVAALITPIEVVRRDVAISILFGVALVVLLLVAARDGPVPRSRGVVLLGGYVASLVALLVVQG